MKSLKQLFKMGNGPSSSHTMGPKNACLIFMDKYQECDNYIVTLFESLALTGKGHLTDYIIKETLKNVVVKFDIDTNTKHPNTLIIEGYKGNELVASETYYSVGGGQILVEGESLPLEKDIYKENNLEEVIKYCLDNNLTLDEYVDYYEQIDDYLVSVLHQMKKTLDDGLNKRGLIPGKLKLQRKAYDLYHQENLNNIKVCQNDKKIMAYAYALAEENASGNIVVTAPTCGASGVLPAVIYYLKDVYNTSEETMLKGLKIAGIIGNVVKQNGSISGAEAGCQAEIGTATSMASAYAAYIFGGTIRQIERAAEIALEHNLGLTCDPVMGYVQIPCIERNAIGAIYSLDAAKLALYLNDNNARVSFDMVVSTMKETGVSLPSELRETSKGGLALKIKDTEE